MKKYISLILAFVFAFCFVACSKSQSDNELKTTTESTTVQTSEVQTSEPTTQAVTEESTEKETEKSDENEEKIVTMTVDGKDVVISLNDSSAAKTLYDMLPIDVNFNDFNSTEKMPSLADDNDEKDKSDYEPNIGDFGLLGSDGSLSVLNKAQSPAESFNKLGEIKSGLDTLLAQNGDFSATLNKAE